MTARDVIRRLETDQPRFHFADAAQAARGRELGYAMDPGEFSMAVGGRTLNWFADNIPAGATTLETGAGYTTTVLGTLATRHWCLTPSQAEADRITNYLTEIGGAAERVTFVIGPSDRTLPGLTAGPLDFAYIDGCHGYPFPALDWHYVDLLLKVGGVVGMDNVELPPVRQHCDFLTANGSYTEIDRFWDRTAEVRLFRKVREEDREWVHQPWSVTGVGKPPGPPLARRLLVGGRRFAGRIARATGLRGR